MVKDVIRLILCFFIGYLVGGFGKYLVASMALAASDAVVVGPILGFVIGVIFITVRQCVEYFD